MRKVHIMPERGKSGMHRYRKKGNWGGERKTESETKRARGKQKGNEKEIRQTHVSLVSSRSKEEKKEKKGTIRRRIIGASNDMTMK